MNKDQAKGPIKHSTEKLQPPIGQASSDKLAQGKGVAKQAAGDDGIQKKVGDTKQGSKDPMTKS